jgi:magnesium-transporting ATPase (P-type)
MVILNSSDPKGVCYVETKNLDGETNMKMKTCHKELQKFLKSDQDLTKLSGDITCEKPNNAIYKYEGTMKVPQIQNRISLGAENLVLRGCSVRNTDHIYGLVVFCGHDTKVMMNSQSANYKFSTLEKQTNIAILLVLLS